jgi:hypothetical protein
VNVIIDPNSGPFLETSNLAGSYASGSSQTITWDVANTTSAPVNCANVNITLSTDGGQTFPFVLKANTPNDGTEMVTLPNLGTATTTARIKVMASNNIFFDISNANFSIAADPLPVTLLNIQAAKQGNNVLVSWTTVAESQLATYEVEFSKDGTGFTTFGSVNCRNTQGPNNYSLLHTQPAIGLNYYRLKTISLNGLVKFSQVVSVSNSLTGASFVTVYPNPVKNGSVGLQFNRVEAQTFTVSLFNVAGQQLLQQVVKHAGGNLSTNLQLSQGIPAGTYHLIIKGSKGTDYNQELVVQ